MDEKDTAQFRVEGEPAFPTEDTENDNSADSPSVEETDDDQTQSQEGEQNSGEEEKDGIDNLAKHPRWKEREEDWKQRFNDQEQRHTDDIAKLREDLEKRFGGSQNEQKTPTRVPSWFGGDEDQWQEFVEWNKSLASEAKKEAVKEIETKSSDEQKRIDEATQYFNDQVAEIETDSDINPDNLKVDRNKLLKFVLDNELVDTKGRWNYKAGFKLMQSQTKSTQKAKLNERKKIASDTTNDKHAETKASDFMTSDDFKKPGARPW